MTVMQTIPMTWEDQQITQRHIDKLGPQYDRTHTSDRIDAHTFNRMAYNRRWAGWEPSRSVTVIFWHDHLN